ncbi:hypothetical protein [Levilactobacillus humaensis]|uniref:hypothetical protein n=1 Tax=Levilactobacillus humaensis TaxID=2950375 RepID=UPI0021C2BEEA|nr:hypothetical protein [Levilactobacillus humaensis]
MTNSDIFRKFLIEAYIDQRYDMIRALNWMSRHYDKLPNYFRTAFREMGSQERNKVIGEVLKIDQAS